MLDDNLRTQLQAYLGRITRPIVLVATLDDTDASRELQALLEDVASLSTLITLSASLKSVGVNASIQSATLDLPSVDGKVWDCRGGSVASKYRPSACVDGVGGRVFCRRVSLRGLS